MTDIINIALLSISEKEKIAIRNKYVALNYKVQGIDLVEVLLWISAIFSIALIIVLFFVGWNRSLRKLVNRRTVALQREIIEREQAHNALFESEKKYRSLVDTSLVGVFTSDLEGRFLFVNDALVQKFDFTSREELITAGSIARWADVEQREKYIKELKLSGSVRDFEVVGLSLSHQPIHSLFSAVLCDGVIFGTIMDITKRKKVESALLKSQRESIRAQKIAHLGHWEWDIISDQFTISDEIYKIFGLTIGTLLSSQSILEYIHPEDRDYYIKNRALALESQPDETYTYRIIRPDGLTRTLSTKISTTAEYNDAGRAIRLFGILQDVTELKESEQKLINYQQRLKSLALQLALVEEQERRHIAADLHDNVGQSLALTRLQLAAVLKRLPDDKKTAGLVHNCSQLILTVIQETRHLIFEISSPSLNEFGLAAAITEWKEQTCKLSHGLEIEVIDRLEIDFVNLDLRAIIFRNIRELLINVIKHAKATVVVVNLEEKSGCYQITVKDNGIGFMVDEQAGNVSVAGGFGLFSIQERMIDIGGQLIINAKPQEGCTVIMTLPVIEIGAQ